MFSLNTDGGGWTVRTIMFSLNTDGGGWTVRTIMFSHHRRRRMDGKDDYVFSSLMAVDGR